jgi:UDP-glucose 4-epimerase
LKLADEPSAIGEVFNIGNGAEISICELAYKVKAMTGSQSPVEFVPYSAVFDEGFEDMQRRVPDISKIRRVVGYEPRVHLDEIIRNVIAYWQVERSLPAMPRQAASSKADVDQTPAKFAVAETAFVS